MLQAGRSRNAGGYRFGYQGQELNNKTIVSTPQGQLPTPVLESPKK